MKKLTLRILQILLFLGIYQNVFSQILSVTPATPTVNDTVTIIYDSSEGNAALLGDSPIYAHTGVLTTESQNENDWKYVKTNWGENTPETLMEDLGDNKHRIKFHIKSYYGIPDGVTVTDLAFVFRNESTTLVGRSSSNGDIFYPLYPTTVFEDYQSHSVEENKLSIHTQSRIYTFQAFSEDIVRVGFRPDNIVTEKVSKVVKLIPDVTVGVVTELSEAIKYETVNLQIYIRKSPLRMDYIYRGDTLLKDSPGFYFMGTEAAVNFEISSDEAIHGTGSRAVDLNLRGRKLEIKNQPHYGYGYGTENLNIAIPFVVSSKKYGIYFDHLSPATAGLGQLGNTLAYQAQEQALGFYFIGAESMTGLLDSYTFLSGKAPLPPRWSLGYIQSKYGYETESDARAIVSQMQNENFPLDALVLDLYWFGNTSDMGNLNWDYTRFATPQDMMADFKQVGVKTILITEPYITLNSVNYTPAASANLFATDGSGNPYVMSDFWAGSAALLDLTDTTAQNWMWNFYQQRIEEGVAGWWCDLGEPENHPESMIHHGKTANEVHNYFSWDWAKMLQEKYAENYPEQRLFNLIRSGYAGMQSFGAIPWSGDIQRSYDGLRAQVPIMLNMGYCGVGYMHSDLGGFTGGGQDNELYTRWLQMGAFSPIMRAHGVGVPTEPVYYPEPYKSIVRDFIQLRYQLLPYNYTLAWENAVWGTPLARAMDFYDADNQLLYNEGKQYYWGENLLIAPVLEAGITSREVYLPEGNWVDYFSNQKYSGSQTVNISTPISSIPVFVRSGSFIPHTDLVNSTDAYTADKLSVWYYSDKEVTNSFYRLYNDDGQNPASLKDGEYELIDFSADNSGNTIRIDVEHSGSYVGMPLERDLEFRLKNITQSPEFVQINNSTIAYANLKSEYDNTFPAVFYDANEAELYVHTLWENNSLEILLSTITGIENSNFAKTGFSLQVYPSPVYSKATVSYEVQKEGIYRLEVRNSLGVKVAELLNSFQGAGLHRMEWVNNIGLPAGIYYFSLIGSDNFVTVPVVIAE